MSASPSQQGSEDRFRNAPGSEIEAVADELVTLVEELETAISEGHAPRGFANRLAQLRQTAEELVGR
jgi:hypothetical protein